MHIYTGEFLTRGVAEKRREDIALENRLKREELDREMTDARCIYIYTHTYICICHKNIYIYILLYIYIYIYIYIYYISI
jgi:hypothetical protein